MSKRKQPTNSTHVAELECGHWQRSPGQLVDLELWNSEHPEFPSSVGFGMGVRPAELCQKHNVWTAVVRVTFFEWHVFCHGDGNDRCGYNGWHGIDAEKARADYARHEKLWPSHRVVVGWDSFQGDVLETGTQGQLFVSEEMNEKRRAGVLAREAAVKRAGRRAAHPSSRHAESSPPAFRTSEPSQPVSVNTLGDWNP